MPELPEVETVRRSLEPCLVGRRIVGLSLGAFTGVVGERSSDELQALLVGRHVSGIRRRGKYLLIDLDDEARLIVHLRMTGVLQITDGSAEPLRFQHLAIRLDDGHELRFADQRKFGRVIYWPANAPDLLDERLGPEPLGDEFTSSYLTTRLRGRVAPIKALLLDQRIVAGVGNIYADEALFLAKLHPALPAGQLTADQVELLVASVRQVLSDAIANRGTTFSSYRDANGRQGDNQRRLNVYGRGRRAEPCPACGTPLNVVTVAQRSSHICPKCQPRERG